MAAAQKGRGFLAFQNPKVACFINSALQMITHMDYLFESPEGNEWYMFLRNLYMSKWTDADVDVIPNEFVVEKMKKFLPAQAHYCERQEDAHEFFKHFLDGMKNDALVDNALGGKRLYITTCLSCNKQSDRAESFQQFEINLSAEAADGKAGSKIVNLSEYFQDLFRTETMEGSNAYECSICTLADKRIRTTATRKQGILVYPKYLLFQILRFISGRKSTEAFGFHHTFLGRSTKLRYELVSVIVHYGASVLAGHYVCFGRVDNPDGTVGWLSYNDKIVTHATAQDLTSDLICENVYMLLYEHRPLEE